MSLGTTVPEGNTSACPTIIQEENEGDDGKKLRDQDEEAIQAMEDNFWRSQIEEDKNKLKLAQPEYLGQFGTDANAWIAVMESYIQYYPSRFPNDCQKIIVAVNLLQKTKECKLLYARKY